MAAEGGGLEDVGVQLLALEWGLFGSTEVENGGVGMLMRRPMEWKGPEGLLEVSLLASMINGVGRRMVVVAAAVVVPVVVVVEG